MVSGVSSRVRCVVLRMIVPAMVLHTGPRSVSADTAEWRHSPIPVVLSVGEERVLTFPGPVQVGVPQGLSTAQFRSQSTGGTVLWLARAPFSTERLQVRLIETGEVLLLDVTAVAEPDAEPRDSLEVTIPNRGATRSGGPPGRDVPITAVTLTRYAAQQFFAPERVLKSHPRIRRVPMRVPESLDLYRDARVATRALASWQAEDSFVTAIELKNKGFERLWLDPRLLRGRFVAATFQHNVLGPKPARNGLTIGYLVTNVPIAEAITWPAAAEAKADPRESTD